MPIEHHYREARAGNRFIAYSICNGLAGSSYIERTSIVHILFIASPPAEASDIVHQDALVF